MCVCAHARVRTGIQTLMLFTHAHEEERGGHRAVSHRTQSHAPVSVNHLQHWAYSGCGHT